MIDRGDGPSPVMSEAFITWTHRNFCERLPAEMLVVENPKSGRKITMGPGVLRSEHVRVGRHVAPDPVDLPAFIKRFAEGYTSPNLSRLRKIIGVAASHHRLAWIHPFLDGNGRVARLFSHALLRELDLGSEFWSVSRGLARSVDNYKTMLQAADEPRRGGDLDGRGNLTMAGLTEFCRYFLSICIDQIDFMEGLLEPSELLRRMEIWAKRDGGKAATEGLMAHLAHGSPRWRVRPWRRGRYYRLCDPAGTHRAERPHQSGLSHFRDHP